MSTIKFDKETNTATLALSTVTKTNIVLLQGETPIVLDKPKGFKGKAGDNVVVTQGEDDTLSFKTSKPKTVQKEKSTGRPAEDLNGLHELRNMF